MDLTDPNDCLMVCNRLPAPRVGLESLLRTARLPVPRLAYGPEIKLIDLYNRLCPPDLLFKVAPDGLGGCVA